MSDQPVYADVPERVARGAALLDEKRPGWAALVDLAELDVESCWSCVLGQLYRGAEGAFREPFEAAAVDLMGVDRYGYDPNAPALIEHGFSGTPHEFDNSEFDALTAEWRRVIEQRRSELHPSTSTP